MKSAVQIYSRDFDADFFKFPVTIQTSIQAHIDRLGRALDSHPHHKMKGVEAYRLRVGDYRVIYDFDRATGQLYLFAVGHRREIYR